MYKQLSILAALSMISTAAAAAPKGVTQSNPGFDTGPSNIKKSQLSQSDKDAPHGTGGYYFVNSGFGAGIVDVPQKDIDARKAEMAQDSYLALRIEDFEDKSHNYFSAAASIGLGYTKRLDNDLVLGGEVEIGFPIVKPKFVLGYMVSDNDQISINFGYNLLPRLLMGKKATKNLSALSGAGIDLAYQHFFTNGAFLRFSLMGEYYSGAPNALLNEIVQNSYDTFSYDSTIFDVKVGFAYGMQW